MISILKYSETVFMVNTQFLKILCICLKRIHTLKLLHAIFQFRFFNVCFFYQLLRKVSKIFYEIVTLSISLFYFEILLYKFLRLHYYKKQLSGNKIVTQEIAGSVHL